MATKKYLDYEGLQKLVENINKKYAPISAIVFKQTVDDIASLPALNTQKAGWMYNVKTGGETTADFVEGAGHLVSDGENIAAVELLTGEYTKVASPAATDDPKALGWYEEDVVTYVNVTADLKTTDDPSAMGLYEQGASVGDYVLTGDTSPAPGKDYFRRDVTYKLSQDRLPVSGKDYFIAGTVMKWDLMGGVFDLEDRYLEFGDAFPQGPASRMTDGRTFLFMGETVKAYTYVASPEGRPSENGYFEGTFTAVDPSVDPIYNPHQQGLYEADAVTTGVYVLSEDKTYDSAKTYYSGAFVASTDPSVDPAKFYYTEADLYKKAGIYTYDSSTNDWVLESAGGSGDMIPITNAEIDDLFI